MAISSNAREPCLEVSYHSSRVALLLIGNIKYLSAVIMYNLFGLTFSHFIAGTLFHVVQISSHAQNPSPYLFVVDQFLSNSRITQIHDQSLKCGLFLDYIFGNNEKLLMNQVCVDTKIRLSSFIKLKLLSNSSQIQFPDVRK